MHSRDHAKICRDHETFSSETVLIDEKYVQPTRVGSLAYFDRDVSVSYVYL